MTERGVSFFAGISFDFFRPGVIALRERAVAGFPREFRSQRTGWLFIFGRRVGSVDSQPLNILTHTYTHATDAATDRRAGVLVEREQGRDVGRLRGIFDPQLRLLRLVGDHVSPRQVWSRKSYSKREQVFCVGSLRQPGCTPIALSARRPFYLLVGYHECGYMASLCFTMCRCCGLSVCCHQVWNQPLIIAPRVGIFLRTRRVPIVSRLVISHWQQGLFPPASTGRPFLFLPNVFSSTFCCCWCRHCRAHAALPEPRQHAEGGRKKWSRSGPGVGRRGPAERPRTAGSCSCVSGCSTCVRRVPTRI